MENRVADVAVGGVEDGAPDGEEGGASDETAD